MCYVVYSRKGKQLVGSMSLFVIERFAARGQQETLSADGMPPFLNAPLFHPLPYTLVGPAIASSAPS